MTARTIVEAERRENLVAFEEAFARLEGIADEHVTTLRRASTTRPGSPYPQSEDPLGQAAYTAAALRGLVEALAALQGNEARSMSWTTK
jgi:methyl coenzyme M reductase gamma subunit